MKSFCQVVSEKIVAFIYLEPGIHLEPLGSISSLLGIPFLVLDSSDWFSRLSTQSSLSSVINLAPQHGIVGRVLSEVIKAKYLSGPSVIVYKNDNEFLLIKSAAKTLLQGDTKLLELKEDEDLTEQLSSGTV